MNPLMPEQSDADGLLMPEMNPPPSGRRRPTGPPRVVRSGGWGLILALALAAATAAVLWLLQIAPLTLAREEARSRLAQSNQNAEALAQQATDLKQQVNALETQRAALMSEVAMAREALAWSESVAQKVLELELFSQTSDAGLLKVSRGEESVDFWFLPGSVDAEGRRAPGVTQGFQAALTVLANQARPKAASTLDIEIVALNQETLFGGITDPDKLRRHNGHPFKKIQRAKRRAATARVQGGTTSELEKDLQKALKRSVGRLSVAYSNVWPARSVVPASVADAKSTILVRVGLMPSH